MALVAWVRDRLWRANDWIAELARLRAGVAAEPVSVRQIERTLDLAEAYQACDPDRAHALALYLDASRGGHPEARGPARQLATSLGAHLTLGELALADNDQATAAAAYLDAGVPELALEPLRKLVARKEAGATEAAQLLAIAERKPFDAARAITAVLAGGGTASAFVHAARLARLAKLDDRIPQIITAAARAHPDDAEVAALVETLWFDAGNADSLMAHYRGRFERAASPADSVERLRLAGIELTARNLQPGLGLRMLRMSLEQAYEARLPELASHIATWELLVAHARAQTTARELVPLIVQAMAASLSDDVAVYLARLGLEIAWRDAGDTLAAQPYAATLLDFVPDHPLAAAFSRELGLPVPAPALPLPPPPAALPTATTKMPRLEDGQVKRSYVPPAPAKPSITGRLALLKPPAPRATSLKRDTSPIPIAPQPRAATPPRAPRTIVPVDAVIELPTGSFFTTVLRDLSASGAFIMTKRNLEVGLVVAIELEMPVTGSLEVRTHRTNARIARRTDVGCGLAFVDPPPELVAAIRTTEFLLSVAQES